VPSTFTTGAVAVGLARRGWPVFPCHHPLDDGRCSCGHDGCASPGKHPRTRHGLHQATTDATVIRRWWRRSPGSNVAVRTGARPAGAGVVVIDIDPAHGSGDALAELEQAHDPLPPTLEAVTGGGGRHLWFSHPGIPVPNSAGRLGRGIDVRGDGGYILVSPSRHISGGRYRWQEAPIAAMPPWLVARCLPPEPAPTGRAEPPAHLDAWARAALDAETAAVRAAVEGTRNHTLNRAAFALGQLVGSGTLEEADVVDQLADAAAAAGLGDHEARATIASGLRAGTAVPRHRRVSP
jgi:hypothetical protein